MKHKKQKRLRLDDLIVQRAIASDRTRACALLLAGMIQVEGVEDPKAGDLVSPDQELKLIPQRQYVSRAGDKLAFALDHFAINPSGRICADVGAATGGFSDVLLQRGAHRVFAVDVGYGDLAWKVRANPKLVPIERTNARYLKALPEPPSLIAVDVSFISVVTLLPTLKEWYQGCEGELVVLIKPQFEARSEQIAPGGIVEDAAVRAQSVASVVQALGTVGFDLMGTISSPILGMHGNQEFLAAARCKK